MYTRSMDSQRRVITILPTTFSRTAPMRLPVCSAAVCGAARRALDYMKLLVLQAPKGWILVISQGFDLKIFVH